MAVKAINPS